MSICIRVRLGLIVLVAGCVGVLVFGCVSVLAVEARPGWEVTSTTFPTNIAPSGGTGFLELSVYNIGAEPSGGGPRAVTVTDVLPKGVVATEAGDVQNGTNQQIGEDGLWECTGNAPGEALPRKTTVFEPATVVTCVNSEALPTLPIPEVRETISEEGAGAIEQIGVAVRTVTPVQGVLRNSVTIAGGGALAPASTTGSIVVSSAPASVFGFQDFDGWFSAPDGTIQTQAGSHPYEFMTSFDLNSAVKGEALEPVDGDARNLSVNLPPGFIGNPTAVPRCNRQQFDNEECDPSTQVGVGVPEQTEGRIKPARHTFAIYNLLPPPGEPAQFGFDIAGIQAFIDANVRSGGDYGITAHVNDIPQTIHFTGVRTILWGEPSDPAHNEDRYSNFWESGACRSGCSSSAPRVPFLTLPTSCAGPQQFTASSNTWETNGFGEGAFLTHDSNDTPTGFTGCDHLGFNPTISSAPDTSRTDTPAGLTVDVHAPQEGLETPGALTTSNIKNTTVTLPQGIVINPGQAAGLTACSYSQSGVGIEPTPSAPSKGTPECPNSSKVGTDEAQTPILFKPLTGSVYVLQSNPPHLKLLAVLTGEGIDVKLVLNVNLNTQTGQITTTVENVPEAPVSDFKISFTGGAQAALDTPTQCGNYQTTSDFKPWSTPTVPDVLPSSTLNINSSTEGGSCPSSQLPFSPTLTAGSTTDQAGAFTDFSLLLKAPDGQKRTEKLQFEFPPGFSAELGDVALCPEPLAEKGECSETSKIGHATVASGPGPFPLVIPQPGDPESQMYLTGPYNGTGGCSTNEPGCAPFGLSIVTHVIAGPFNLGTIITRGRIEVDPRTAQITITTNPLPQIVEGVPTDLRLVNAVADRPGFIFNPTNCNLFSFAGTAWGTAPPGNDETRMTAPISSHFQVGSCQSLKFNPTFSATTSSKTTKKYGTSLTLKVTRPSGPTTQQANFQLVKIALPKQLPSRLTTLQKACTAAQFETNPAGCPAPSVVGHVKVITPVLPVPLEGPAYFVSHGSEAFPNLTFLLQGYGIKLDVISNTFISKAGVTTGTLKTVPDEPFTSFELTLPAGNYSVFTGMGNLCTEKLTMPTEFIAQNGLQIHQNTKIAVTGCTKKKTPTRAQKLVTALKTCHKHQNKTKRHNCETQAHKKYGPTKH
jgi:hypothetical protein